MPSFRARNLFTAGADGRVRLFDIGEEENSSGSGENVGNSTGIKCPQISTQLVQIPAFHDRVLGVDTICLDDGENFVVACCGADKCKVFAAPMRGILLPTEAEEEQLHEEAEKLLRADEEAAAEAAAEAKRRKEAIAAKSSLLGNQTSEVDTALGAIEKEKQQKLTAIAKEDDLVVNSMHAGNVVAMNPPLKNNRSFRKTAKRSGVEVQWGNPLELVSTSLGGTNAFTCLKLLSAFSDGRPKNSKVFRHPTGGSNFLNVQGDEKANTVKNTCLSFGKKAKSSGAAANVTAAQKKDPYSKENLCNPRGVDSPKAGRHVSPPKRLKTEKETAIVPKQTEKEQAINTSSMPVATEGDHKAEDLGGDLGSTLKRSLSREKLGLSGTQNLTASVSKKTPSKSRGLSAASGKGCVALTGSADGLLRIYHISHNELVGNLATLPKDGNNLNAVGGTSSSTAGSSLKPKTVTDFVKTPNTSVLTGESTISPILTYPTPGNAAEKGSSGPPALSRVLCVDGSEWWVAAGYADGTVAVLDIRSAITGLKSEPDSGRWGWPGPNMETVAPSVLFRIDHARSTLECSPTEAVLGCGKSRGVASVKILREMAAFDDAHGPNKILDKDGVQKLVQQDPQHHLTIYTASLDGSVKVWNVPLDPDKVPDGRCTLTYTFPGGTVTIFIELNTNNGTISKRITCYIKHPFCRESLKHLILN